MLKYLFIVVLYFISMYLSYTWMGISGIVYEPLTRPVISFKFKRVQKQSPHVPSTPSQAP